MSGPAPDWMIHLGTVLVNAVLVYCLWTGKVGHRGGSVTTRAKNPLLYWIMMIPLVVIVAFMINESIKRLAP